MSTASAMTGTTSSDPQFGEGITELSSRSGNGIDVSLLWQECNNTAIVAVVDHGTGETFQLDVREHDNALDIFHHPYAYVAHRRLDHAGLADGQDLWMAA
jgi:hypothetical protein